MAELARALEVWTVGTATAVTLVVSLVLVGHLDGRLARVLPELGTEVASILFGYLWLLAIVAAGHVTIVEPGDPAVELGRTAAAGAVVALVYLTVLLIVAFVTPVPDSIVPDPTAVFWVVLGGTVAGGVVGATFGAIFLVCDRLAARLAAGR